VRSLRSRGGHLLREARYALPLLGLPPHVAAFHWRARKLAWRIHDGFTLTSATRPRDLKLLLSLARGRRLVVELGTATAWTAIALALADSHREVISYDPVERAERARYLELVTPETRSRITFVSAPGSSGPRDLRPVDLLYVDSLHEYEGTIAELQAWTPVLHPGALIVLDDYTHPAYPGVRQAIQELALAGEQRGTLFVHRVS
jgi:predicted O-methyltransferase YrrM